MCRDNVDRGSRAPENWQYARSSLFRPLRRWFPRYLSARLGQIAKRVRPRGCWELGTYGRRCSFAAASLSITLSLPLFEIIPPMKTLARFVALLCMVVLLASAPLLADSGNKAH